MNKGKKPYFSIVIPTFNRAGYIDHAIESVMSQTFTDWELIIVDDGSTDDTSEVVKKYQDPNIHYHFQENAERSVARNKGISLSNGTYICFLDSDDWFLENHLQSLHTSIKEHAEPCAMFYTGLYFYKNQAYTPKKLPDSMNPNMVEHVLFYTIYPTSSCVHRDIFKDFKFADNMFYSEDVALWVHIATKYPVFQVNNHTCVVNIHEKSTTQEYSRKFTISDVETKLNIFREKVLLDEKVISLLDRKTINRYISRFYYWHFYESYERKMILGMIYFYVKYLFYYPANMLHGNAYKALLDFFQAIFQKIRIFSTRSSIPN